MKHKYPYGIIGNCSYLAYIHQNSSIDWMCMPRFDSNSLFSALLDSENGGRFQIILDHEEEQSKQYYLPNTNILCTELHGKAGAIKITDFAPRFFQQERYFRPLMLIRKLEVLKGSPIIRVLCNPKGNYGREQPDILHGSNHIRYLNIGDQVRLTTDIPLVYVMEQKEFLLSGTAYLVFTYGVPLESAIEYTCEDFLTKTTNYWQGWVKTMSISTFFQDEIIRSALALKLHQYEDTGGIIAAGTMSLPEFNNSGRNWDYRYCWMRDTYYTLQAFNNIGHFEESERYSRYIENILIREDVRIQPLYKVGGESAIEEIILEHLPGYLNTNSPVRLGNAAYTHIQNDVYGQIMVSLLPLFNDSRFIHHNRTKLAIIHKLLNFIERSLEEEDAGIWEFRNKKQLHTYTFLFHWAGAHASRKIALRYKDTALLSKADDIIKKSTAVIERSYDDVQKTYCQAADSKEPDASTLQLISLGYLDPRSERARQHLKAIEESLVTKKEMVFRYKHYDDFGTPENSFLVCSFWYVDALACCGYTEKAVEVFSELMNHSNHLGLLSEDIGLDGSQWGNFPQTYSHVGLMNAASRISRILDKPTFL